jgi:hypothetical protein
LKTENPSACATVNWKLCKSGMALCLSMIKRTCNRGANKFNHQNMNPLFASHVPPYKTHYYKSNYQNAAWGIYSSENLFGNESCLILLAITPLKEAF